MTGFLLSSDPSISLSLCLSFSLSLPQCCVFVPSISLSLSFSRCLSLPTLCFCALPGRRGRRASLADSEDPLQPHPDGALETSGGGPVLAQPGVMVAPQLCRSLLFCGVLCSPLCLAGDLLRVHCCVGFQQFMGLGSP